MKVFTTFPQADLRDIPNAVKVIEEDGYDGIVALENRHDPFLPLAVAAVNSERLTLATGVAIAFPRSPMVAPDDSSWDLAVKSGGITRDALAFLGFHPPHGCGSTWKPFVLSGIPGH